jgi:hypothetical protein
VPPIYSLSNPILKEVPLELEKSQPKVRGRAIVVTVGIVIAQFVDKVKG